MLGVVSTSRITVQESSAGDVRCLFRTQQRLAARHDILRSAAGRRLPVDSASRNQVSTSTTASTAAGPQNAAGQNGTMAGPACAR